MLYGLIKYTQVFVIPLFANFEGIQVAEGFSDKLKSDRTDNSEEFTCPWASGIDLYFHGPG